MLTYTCGVGAMWVQPLTAPLNQPTPHRCKMPTKANSTTPATPAVKVVCQYCGKTITKGKTVAAGCGSRCATIAKQFSTPAKMQAHYKRITVAVIPKGFITVGSLDKTVKAKRHAVAGLTITKMVNAIGKDRGNLPPIHPIAQPYYLPNRHRVVHGWLATPAGLTAIATSNFSKAPTPPTVSTI